MNELDYNMYFDLVRKLFFLGNKAKGQKDIPEMKNYSYYMFMHSNIQGY